MIRNGLFSAEMLRNRLNAYSISLHLDNTSTPPENRLTAIHTVTYKTRCLHEEELPRIRRNGATHINRLTRVPSNPHERSHHTRLLLVKRSGFQTHVRIGVLTVDTMWRGENAPRGIEDILKGMMGLVDHGEEDCWSDL